ncbi:hypothetical protein AKJ09_05581 [Labilithrix luteola]|uniref:Uncharacterized protein n=1 Tax=Labilithrix luteola TaxID=1391654 RepID=A0A0K1PZJ6_9BACT|nr:hypothetical protein AKJ09_05581 [Labilithrix luteola]
MRRTLTPSDCPGTLRSIVHVRPTERARVGHIDPLAGWLGWLAGWLARCACACACLILRTSRREAPHRESAMRDFTFAMSRRRRGRCKHLRPKVCLE